jgi:hypothetical protein
MGTHTHQSRVYFKGYSRNLVGGEKKEEKVFKMKTLGRPWFQSSVLG